MALHGDTALNARDNLAQETMCWILQATIPIKSGW